MFARLAASTLARLSAQPLCYTGVRAQANLALSEHRDVQTVLLGLGCGSCYIDGELSDRERTEVKREPFFLDRFMQPLCRWHDPIACLGHEGRIPLRH